MTNHYLLYDCNAIAHSVLRANSHPIIAGTAMVVVRGFILKILTIAQQCQNLPWAKGRVKPIFTWDSTHNFRRNFDPLYKITRLTEKTPEEQILLSVGYQEFKLLQFSVLKQLGFSNIVMVEGYEADDIIAAFSKKIKVHSPVTIVSRDSDLYQLLDDNCYMFDYISRNTITSLDIGRDYGVDPRRWSMVKAIAGCGADNVIGIKGVGYKTAAKWLSGKCKEGSAVWNRIVDSEEKISNNFVLVDLPLAGFPDGVVKVRKDTTSLDSLIDLSQRYGFTTILKSEKIQKRWEVTFCE